MPRLALPHWPDLGLLLLRLNAGGFMAWLHGWGKVEAYSERVTSFKSFLGLPPPVEYTLLVGAEFFAAIAIVLGLFTRWAAIPLVIAMLVAGFIAHGADPWSKKELALMYCLQYVAIFCLGPGRWSLDAWWGARQGAGGAVTDTNMPV